MSPTRPSKRAFTDVSVLQARTVLDTPTPRVYAWNSKAKENPVGAEFIVMEKAEGVPLSQAWSGMNLSQKLQILLAMTSFQNRWLGVTFSHYGSLYYAEDVQPPERFYYVENKNTIKDSRFTVGPITGRDWCDADRLCLNIDRGPCV